MREIDVWRTAKVLIDTYGKDAALQAAMRADHALAEGKPDIVIIWKNVAQAVGALQRPKP